MLQNRGRPERSPYAAARRRDDKHRHRLVLMSAVLVIEPFGLLVPGERRFSYGRPFFDALNGRPGRDLFGFWAAFPVARTDAMKIPQKRGEGGEQKQERKRQYRELYALGSDASVDKQARKQAEAIHDRKHRAKRKKANVEEAEEVSNVERRPQDQASYHEGDERQDNCERMMDYRLWSEWSAEPTDNDQENQCGSRNPERPGKKPFGQGVV